MATHPYYPAQLAPLGARLKGEGPPLRIDHVLQEGAVVTIGLFDADGKRLERQYAFDQCVYVSPDRTA